MVAHSRGRTPGCSEEGASRTRQRVGTVTWSERSKLPYTYAVIMESLRWKTLVPVNNPRMAREDIQVQGYDIPKNSYIIVNNCALHNDPKYWTEADKFIPERFLTTDGKQLNYKRDSYNPFSYVFDEMKCDERQVKFPHLG
ncbi:tabersonine/lochnericine 19-hydroxylase-like [Stegodyphus dumicola]|uniref:tabersonine/lochnericine 19-hydroxylase-like n=1 Tax=Stegodyphus dumicola TaxID=202533 RepID=UPI0015AE68E8|nr:tabersonine/lochnericine 19-hydroxylase-like [Stegodyphus dumicola]